MPTYAYKAKRGPGEPVGGELVADSRSAAIAELDARGLSPVQVVEKVGSGEQAFRFWQILLQEGVFVNPVTTPAVPPGMDLLRCSFMATHSEEQIDRFLVGFARARSRLERESAIERTAVAG